MIELQKFSKVPRLWRNSFLQHNFHILSVTVWATENKPSPGFALAVLLMSSQDYFWLLILIANRTTWMNTKVTANRYFQSQPKLDTMNTIDIYHALTTHLNINTANYYQFCWKASNIRSRWAQQTNLDLSIMQ